MAYMLQVEIPQLRRINLNGISDRAIKSLFLHHNV